MTAAPEPVRLDRLPMAEDRTAAYGFLRAAGVVGIGHLPLVFPAR